MIFGPTFMRFFVWIEDRVLALTRLFDDAPFSPFLASKFFQIQLQAHLQTVAARCTVIYMPSK